MSVLWRNGSGTVAEVRDALADRPSYTTVLKVLQILEAKGSVTHGSEGRAYRYSPVVQPDETGSLELGRILEKVFQGSGELLLACLLSSQKIPTDQLEKMLVLLQETLGKEHP